MNFVNFATQPTPVKIEGVAGMLNGYKVNSVYHGGREVNLRPMDYYYIPFTKELVTYRASKARSMKPTKTRKFNMQEKIEHGFHRAVRVDVSEFYHAASAKFN